MIGVSRCLSATVVLFVCPTTGSGPTHLAMSSVPSSEESLLLLDSGDSDSLSAAGDRGAAPTVTVWPSTFERSIGLLASPIIAAADADAFTKLSLIHI